MEKVYHLASVHYVSARNGRNQIKRIKASSRKSLRLAVEHFIQCDSSPVAYVRKIVYYTAVWFPTVPFSCIKNRSFDELPEYYGDLPW